MWCLADFLVIQGLIVMLDLVASTGVVASGGDAPASVKMDGVVDKSCCCC